MEIWVKKYVCGTARCHPRARQLPAQDLLWRQRLGALFEADRRLALPFFVRQLPARNILENLPIFRCQTRASFHSRAARACALSRLFRFTASADRQMTPALFVPLFRACALSRHSLADWLFALPPVALIPCAQHCAGLRAGVVGRWTLPCLSRRGLSAEAQHKSQKLTPDVL